jgi:hypothetical protein
MAVGALGLLAGVVVSNRQIVTLKPEFSMDGIATIVAGLVLVIALNVVAANHLERRHSTVALLTADVREVATAARAVHDYIMEIRGPGTQKQLSAECQQRLQSLMQEYSNSLVIVDHTLELCRFDAKAELSVCKRDRERYKDLVTGGSYPTIDGTVFRAESGEHTAIQNNLRALLFKIG